jgi:hypothetical protein
MTDLAVVEVATGLSRNCEGGLYAGRAESYFTARAFGTW